MSFRDQTYLVILNWLCSVDLVSHLGIASCVSGSFNFRPLRKKKPYLISQCLFSSARLWFHPSRGSVLPAAGLLSPYLTSSSLLPAFSHLLLFPFSAKTQAKWVLEAPTRRWEQGWRGEVGEGDRLPHVVLVRCRVGSSHRSHPPRR